jgi:phage terminase small subunit
MPAQARLTAKQVRFVEEYLVDLNATQAAIRAGYSAKTAQQMGAENLSKPVVAAAIEAGKAARSKRTTVTADRVVEELARVAFSDMREFTHWGATGVTLKESATLPADMARCVAEVSQTVTQHGGSIRFKLHDKVAALTKLLEHTSTFGDKATADFADLTKLSDEELEGMRRKLRLVS